jgi:methionyl-tRNA formyltransferase
MRNLRIIFMGTPEFAVESLEAIVEAGYKVVAVITAPDKPKGRGRKLAMSPVKESAIKHNIPVLQPTNLKSPDFIEELKAYRANLQVVVAFRMLPEVVWSMPEYGTFNLHASLLPQYRGAAPINWALINGEKKTGVTTFFLQHEIDTGNVILQEKEPIDPLDTLGDLYARLMKKGAQLVVKTVEAVEKESYTLSPQQEPEEMKHAPKIFKEDCEINWSKPAREVHNFIRGLSPFPAAWTHFHDVFYKILRTKPVDKDIAGEPGTIESDGKKHIWVKCGEGAIEVLELQKQGKKKMTAEEFLRGNTI